MKKQILKIAFIFSIFILQFFCKHVFAQYQPICEASGAGKCYYVSQANGDDASNDGSFDRPWKSFKNIVTYYGTADNGSTLKPVAWVDLKPGDYVYVYDGTYSDVYNYYGAISVITFRFKNGSSDAQFHLKSYPGQNPVINPGYLGKGIYLLQSSWWEIEGIEISNALNVGLDINSDHVLIDHVKIHDTDGTDNNNMAGIRGTGSNDIEVSNSSFYDNYDRINADTNGQATENSSNAVFFNGGNVSIHDSLFYQTPPVSAVKSGTCLKFKHAQINPSGYFKVYNNKFNQCKFLAIGTGTQNSEIYNNVITNGGGIVSKDFGGVTHQTNQTFSHNTLYITSGFDLGPTDIWSDVNFSDPRNITFKDNIVYEDRSVSNQDAGTVDIGTYASDSLYQKTAPELTFSNNCYYNLSNTIKFNLFAANNPSDNSRPQFGSLGGQYSFNDWKTIGFNYDTASIYSDPLLNDPVNGDFRPKANSPACRAASDGGDIGALACISSGGADIIAPANYSISNLLTLVTNWLKPGTVSDTNADGVVNMRDLGIMMSKWGN